MTVFENQSQFQPKTKSFTKVSVITFEKPRVVDMISKLFEIKTIEIGSGVEAI